MANSNNTTDCKHVSDLKLPYLEDLLSLEEKLEFEKHLSSCPECAAELEATRQLSETLRNKPQVLCPEPWEIFECAQDPQSISTSMKAHLEHCSPCTEHMEAFKTGASERGMPQHLWEKLTAVSDQSAPAKPQRSIGEWIEAVSDAIQGFLRTPAFAMATAAAVILVVVLVYPNLHSEPTAMLSHVQWESVELKRRLMGSGTLPGEAQEGRQRVAELIFVEQARKYYSSNLIDTIYSQLEPTEELVERYYWVTPAEVKEAVLATKVDMTDKEAMIRTLRSKLEVSLAVLVTISPGETEQLYNVSVELVDTRTGEAVAQQVAEDIKKEAAVSKIRAATLFLLTNDSNDRVR